MTYADVHANAPRTSTTPLPDLYPAGLRHLPTRVKAAPRWHLAALLLVVGGALGVHGTLTHQNQPTVPQVQMVTSVPQQGGLPPSSAIYVPGALDIPDTIAAPR